MTTFKISYLRYSFTNIDTNEILIWTSACLILQNWHAVVRLLSFLFIWIRNFLFFWIAADWRPARQCKTLFSSIYFSFLSLKTPPWSSSIRHYLLFNICIWMRLWCSELFPHGNTTVYSGVMNLPIWLLSWRAVLRLEKQQRCAHKPPEAQVVAI